MGCPRRRIAKRTQGHDPGTCALSTVSKGGPSAPGESASSVAPKPLDSLGADRLDEAVCLRRESQLDGANDWRQAADRRCRQQIDGGWSKHARESARGVSSNLRILDGTNGWRWAGNPPVLCVGERVYWMKRRTGGRQQTDAAGSRPTESSRRAMAPGRPRPAGSGSSGCEECARRSRGVREVVL